MRYDNECVGGLLPLSVHIFKEVYITKVRSIVIKFHVKPIRCRKAEIGFWVDWIGTLIAMGNIKVP